VDLLSRRLDLAVWRSNDFINTGDNPVSAVRSALGLRSRKINLRAGDFYAMQAAYISGNGGDNFAVGAIVHDTSVNRKDSPSAIDEKQLISLEMSTAYEVHNITVAGFDSGANSTLYGTFSLALGGKESRPIAADASAAAVAAAIRELLSNCEGDVGDEYDAAGNTFDCWQGTGVEYRGLASRTVSGKVCQDWYKTPIWDPSLALTVGLEKNLCRNPTNDRWLGVWCYNSNMIPEKCAVARCGGDDCASISLISTFEDEEDVGLPRTNAWDYHLGVVPTVVAGDSFCGRNSLYLPNSFSQPRIQWRRQQQGCSRVNEMLVYSTRDFPFICMAYKIPPGTNVSMQLGMAQAGQTWTSSWRTLSITNDVVAPWAPFLISFDIKNDGHWHYTCLDVNSSLVPGDPDLVADIRFFTEGVSSSTYANNPFWIDEFSISRTYRQVVKSEYPSLNGILPRLISVSRTKMRSGFTWTVTLTSENCSSPAVRFDINTSGLFGDVELASDLKVQDHSSPLDGEVIISFMGEFSTFKPYSSAADLRTQLLRMSTLSDVAVHRAGVCQTGFSWLVTFTHVPGDLPLLQVSDAAVSGMGYNTSMRVETVNDGGLLVSPLPAEYFHVPENSSPTLNVWLDEGAFKCAIDASNSSKCPFQFLESLTPLISSVEVENSSVPFDSMHLPSYIISGKGFRAQPSNGGSAVQVGNATCSILNITDVQIKCRLLQPIQAGSYPIFVNVAGKGLARGNQTVSFPLQITSVTPAEISSTWPTILKLSGVGFSVVDLSSNEIMVTAVDKSFVCTPLNATAIELFCITDPAGSFPSNKSYLPKPFRRDLSPKFQLVVTIGAIQSLFTGSLSVLDLEIPSISGIIPNHCSAGGFCTITIHGSGFSEYSNINSVFIGGASCPVKFSSNSTITCLTQPHLPGSFNVSILVENIGSSMPTSATSFEYLLDIEDLRPRSVSITGGVLITASGHGLVNGKGYAANISVVVPGWTVYVIGVYTALPVTEIHDITLRGAYVNDVQTITIHGQWVTHFKVTLYGRESESFPRDVNQYVLQSELARHLPFGSVRIYRQESLSGQVIFRLEFRGNLGSVPLMTATGCGSDDHNGCFPGEGVNSTKLVNGMAPAGIFTLMISGVNREVRVNVNASDADIQSSISTWGIDGGVTAEKFDATAGVIWRIVFNNVQDVNHVMSVDSSEVRGGVVTAARVRDGSVPPAGYWQLHYSGVSTVMLPLNASETLVQSSLAEALQVRSEVIAVEVISADNAGGALKNRFYPRQWMVRIQRTDAAGTGREKCTKPEYIDWDPSSCPSTAADLYLSYYPYYWPSQLPQPANLGSLSQQISLQNACDREAISLHFVPSTCQSLRPSQTLPYCGVGSGNVPPCWVTRFEKATVQFHTGESVTFVLDVSKAPSDVSKGYLFWTRVDQAALAQSQSVVLSSNILSGDAGMDLNFHHSVSASVKSLDVTSIDDHSAVFQIPDFADHLPVYTDILTSDVLYVPLIIWRFNSLQTNRNESFTASNVTSTPGVLQSGQAALFSAAQLSSAQIPLPSDSSQFTLDFWLRHNDTLQVSSCSFVVRAMSNNSLAFALSVCKQNGTLGKVRILYNTEWEYSVLEGTELIFGAWTHIAISSDSNDLRLYQDGKLSNSSSLPLTWDSTNVSLLLGSGCTHATSEDCSRSNAPCFSNPHCGRLVGSREILSSFGNSQYVPFEGSVDWILWYSSVLTAATIQGHSRFANSVRQVSVQAKHGTIFSKCTGCQMFISDELTPRILNVLPNSAPPGSPLTISGRFPLGSNTSLGDVEVHVGSFFCGVIEVSSSHIVCILSDNILADRYTLRVIVSGIGISDSWSFAVAPLIKNVNPSFGASILGGSRITINGDGFSSGAVVLVGDTPCSIVNLSRTIIMCDIGYRNIPLDPDIVATVKVVISSSSSLSMCNASSEAAPFYSPSATLRTAMSLSTQQADEGSTSTSNSQSETHALHTSSVAVDESTSLSTQQSSEGITGDYRTTSTDNVPSETVASHTSSAAFDASMSSNTQQSSEGITGDHSTTSTDNVPPESVASHISSAASFDESISSSTQQSSEGILGNHSATSTDNVPSETVASHISSAAFDASMSSSTQQSNGSIPGNHSTTSTKNTHILQSDIGAFSEAPVNFMMNASKPRASFQCSVHLSYVWTPVIVDVSPRLVHEGSLLVVLGRRLPKREGPPSVSIGESRCRVLDYNWTHIVCIVGLGEGGPHPVTIRYARGYAADLSARNCQESWISYLPTVNAIFPTSGSLWGNTIITMLGSGFSSASGNNIVLFGSVLCMVLAADSSRVIVRIPSIDDPELLRSGLERTGINLSKCARSYSFYSNESVLETYQPVFPIELSSQIIPMIANGRDPLIVSPASGTDSAFLVDGLQYTIWRSKSGQDLVWISIDLMSEHNISAVILEWHSIYIAAVVRVALVASINGSVVSRAQRGFCWPIGAAPNLARSCGNGSQSCLANQSSTLLGLDASRAVDGNQSQTQPFESCASTGLDRAPWWRIDFGTAKKILGGTIWSRNQYPERLDGFQVYIGNGSQSWADSANQLCYTDVVTRQSIHDFMPWKHTFDCIGLGRFLYVILPSTQYLSICEIEIYGASEGCAIPKANLVDVFSLRASARFAIIELSQAMDASSDFRLRGLKVLGRSEDNSVSDGRFPGRLEVRVNGQGAICNETSACLYAFNARPILTAVQPKIGGTGDIINITGFGFIDSNCPSHNVTVGESQCIVQACSTVWLQCLLTSHVAGTYAIQMVIQNIGRVSGTLTFTYKMTARYLAPSSGGVGGGLAIRVQGSGFENGQDLTRNSIFLCGVRCELISCSTSELLCMQPALIEPPASGAHGEPRKSNGVAVAVDFNVTEDVLEFAEPWCTSYSVVGNAQYCYCEVEDWMCFWARYRDVSNNVARTKAAVYENWLQIGQFLNRSFACDCDRPAGVRISDAVLLGFDFLNGGSMYAQWTPQIVYFRFTNLQIPRNATISDARLLIYASSSTCRPWSLIRVWAESTSNSQPFAHSKYGDLFGRIRSKKYVDWIVEDGWKWAFGQEQSDDLSSVIQEVIQSPTWNSGSALTLILRQSRSSGGGPCRFLSSESGSQYIPKLRVTFQDAGGQYTVPSRFQTLCDIEVSVLPRISAPVVIPIPCADILELRIADAFYIPSVQDDPLPPGLLPATKACCLSSSRLAEFAIDNLLDTFWSSPSTNALNFTIDLGEAGAVAKWIRMVWTEDFATKYTVLGSSNNDTWQHLANEPSGDGGTDELVLSDDGRQSFDVSQRIRFLRIWIMQPARDGQPGYGIFEISVAGCNQLSALSSTNVTISNAFVASMTQTPTLISVAPSIGSTAGGTRVTLTGISPINVTTIDVDFGGFKCAVQSFSLFNTGPNTTFNIVCISRKCGVTNGGLKYVRIQIDGLGWSLKDPGQVFWYEIFSCSFSLEALFLLAIAHHCIVPITLV
jgi:hypothetical protein